MGGSGRALEARGMRAGLGQGDFIQGCVLRGLTIRNMVACIPENSGGYQLSSTAFSHSFSLIGSLQKMTQLVMISSTPIAYTDQIGDKERSS